MEILLGLIGFIGVMLGIAPFAGLFIDLRKNGKYTLFFGVAGVLILFGTILVALMHNVIAVTFFAFLMTPLLFLYVLLANKTRRGITGEELEDADILDD